jgi:hypothetical protein
MEQIRAATALYINQQFTNLQTYIQTEYRLERRKIDKISTQR